MFRHLLIDETQDTNTVQLDLIETLAREGSGNLTAVGDDAQSIYRFRGANYDNILKFPERNPGTSSRARDISPSRRSAATAARRIPPAKPNP